ncbi:hypothetical protein QJ857_gp0567 [Tupanvirus soda lake]|uniref:Uncharacterized protein n=2 Tax=Tupanvirus TaxID=2094720 RepID=A0A6N1NVL1_9VIRU|nr:hypothetical protein QJ857_gp0567 [Tupanvirus soda lake]QKU35476.1 hypothetical protein [Tupanvirus soda lake]
MTDANYGTNTFDQTNVSGVNATTMGKSNKNLTKTATNITNMATQSTTTSNRGSVTKQNSTNENDLLTAYLRKDYNTLASANLNQPVNNDGDTIIHIMAKNLDKAAFELILLTNPKAITYSVINTPNKKSQLPIHLALEKIQENQQIGDDFINYMINVLGANPDIPDANNRIIVSNIQNKNKTINENENKIKEHNNTVIKNIQSLIKIAEMNTDKLPGSISFSKEPVEMENDGNIDFIHNIIEYYNNPMNKQVSQEGGYNGRRRIRNYFSDGLSESGDNDSFVAKNRNELMNNYDRTDLNNRSSSNHRSNSNMWSGDDRNRDATTQRIIRNEVVSDTRRANESKLRMLGGDFERRNQLRKEEERLRFEEERLRNERLIGGMDNDELRREERRLMEERERLIRNNRPLLGGFTEEDRSRGRRREDQSPDDIMNGGRDNDVTNEDDYEDEMTGGRRGRKNTNNTRSNRGNTSNTGSGSDAGTATGNTRGTNNSGSTYASTTGTGSSNINTGNKRGRKHRNARRFTDNWNTEDFNLNTSDDDTGPKQGSRSSNNRTSSTYDRGTGSNKGSSTGINSTNDRGSNDRGSNDRGTNGRGSNARVDHTGTSSNDRGSKNSNDIGSMGTTGSSVGWESFRNKGNDVSNDRSRNSRSGSRSYGSDYDEDEEEIVNSRQMFDYPNMFTSQDRPRDTQVDDMYRSFVKKIMDFLGVDEETAKFYRSAIKINIENSNPELKKRENDALKVKEMESIFENKAKLQATLDKIDMDFIKKYMRERSEENERRKEERRKERENRSKERRETNRNKGTTSETSSDQGTGTAGTNMTDTTTSNTSATTTKSRGRKTSAQSRIADSGYLQSDEIIFSPNY